MTRARRRLILVGTEETVRAAVAPAGRPRLRARRPAARPRARVSRPAPTRWTSFVADPREVRPRTLHEEGNPGHRLRVEHNRNTILVHLSGEDGHGWTVLAVDRASRRWAVGEGGRQIDAAEAAFKRLYGGPGD